MVAAKLEKVTKDVLKSYEKPLNLKKQRGIQ